jgi:hypothetical protein
MHSSARKKGATGADPAGLLAYVYIDDQDERFDTDIEKHPAQGDECRALSRLLEIE